MSIISFKFVLFLIIAYTLYFFVPKKVKWMILLLASYIFYYMCSTKLIIFIIITTLSIYLSGIKMQKISDNAEFNCKNVDKSERKKIKEASKKSRRRLIICTLALNFGILIVLKYINFIDGNINNIFEIFNLNFKIPTVNWILPLGISYYTLQATSYIIDVYREKYKADTNLGRLALFVCFFPQIVEGPIGRYDKLANQLYEPHAFEYKNLKFGLQLILWGLFKKMVIADRAGLLINNIFNNYTNYSGFTIALAVILYTLQIYAEFSGCIDIVSGISEIIGIKLEQNFKRPFFSKSVQEFWRRWHITLGTWLKDYVFYGVSFSNLGIGINNYAKKNLKGYIAKLIPIAFALFFVWLGNGLWHGASWKYIIYGLYYYLIMMLGMVLEPVWKLIIEKLKIKTDTYKFKIMQILRTICFVFIGMLIFRAPKLIDAINMLKSIITFNGFNKIFSEELLSLGWKRSDCIVLLVSFIILFKVSLLQEKGYKIREKIAEQNLITKWVLYYGIFFSIIIFGIYGSGYNMSNFIYGQF